MLCFVVQVGVVVAANGSHESAKSRRKRKRTEGGGGAVAGAERATWANHKAQKKAFSEAWLTLLQMELPQVGSHEL